MMEAAELYRDIAERTGGDIYIGVVGPVRTGKSTFIKKFMDTLVVPHIDDRNVRERAIDELPQAGSGKTIMTTQPKFVPAEAVKITLNDNLNFKVRMIDCVGYLVGGALGPVENGKERLVHTPWSDDEMPFSKAAEMGTDKVIREHSTIGILVTTDGSIGDIPRDEYIAAEERVVKELKSLNKPFVIVLNSTKPDSPEAGKLRQALNEKYGVAVVAADIANLSAEELSSIIQELLLEFPVKFIDVSLPGWMRILGSDNSIIGEITGGLLMASEGISKMRDYVLLGGLFNNSENLEPVAGINIELGSGRIVVEIAGKEGLFNRILSEECEADISDDCKLMAYVKSLKVAQKEYEKVRAAMEQVAETGYGIVVPTTEQMLLEEPVMVRQGGKFGVRLRASAPALHIMKVDVNTEVSPIVGTEQQGEEMVKYLLSEFESNPKNIWNTNLFGKSLNALVKEGLNNKLNAMPKEAQVKLRKTLSRIINEGKGGIICILL